MIYQSFKNNVIICNEYADASSSKIKINDNNKIVLILHNITVYVISFVLCLP